jgi:hypothetical protein
MVLNRKQRRQQLMEAMQENKQYTPQQIAWLDKHAPNWRETGATGWVTLYDDDPNHEDDLKMARSVGISTWTFTMKPDKADPATIISCKQA